jgi:hypothetical protein
MLVGQRDARGLLLVVVRFSTGTATAHTLVSLAECRASLKPMQNFQIDSSIISSIELKA